ncbi:MAG TPA: nucleoside triphosphate pyrophosphatase [Kofleriaceae bacterium]|jgi:septum formation protein
MLPLLLASASPRRRELLERVGVPLEVRAADVDESPRDGEDPAAYVHRVAREKVQAVTRRPGQWVLAADTIVTIDGLILGKPSDASEAADMLRRLAGREHFVITSYAILGEDDQPQTAYRGGAAMTKVLFASIDDATIAGYVASNEWRGKAGGYAIQGIGAALVAGIEGSVTNVIGLPLVEVLALLRSVGAPSGNLAAGRPE